MRSQKSLPKGIVSGEDGGRHREENRRGAGRTPSQRSRETPGLTLGRSVTLTCLLSMDNLGQGVILDNELSYHMGGRKVQAFSIT